MNTTLNEIITNTLKGRSVVVYEYDALFIYVHPKRVSQWYLDNNSDDRRKKHYHLETHWDDLHIRKHIGTIVSVRGNHINYEGSSITMTIEVNGENKHIPFYMEDTMELIDRIKKHSMT